MYNLISNGTSNKYQYYIPSFKTVYKSELILKSICIYSINAVMGTNEPVLSGVLTLFKMSEPTCSFRPKTMVIRENYELILVWFRFCLSSCYS